MTRQEFVSRFSADLRSLGLPAGSTLLVHSSLSSMGRVEGGPEWVILGLLEALGPEGTLLLPALTYETVTPENPVFDVRTTPSCVGVIPEHFRTRQGTLRSMHPTHSVCAVGPHAQELIEAHREDMTPCGPNSPFTRLPDFGGCILMLGCGLRPNTSMHAVEEAVVPPYLYDPPITYSLTDLQGHTLEKSYAPHGFHGWEQRYDRVADLLSPPFLRSGPVAGAGSHLIDAVAFHRTCADRLRSDPLFFVDRTDESAD